MKKRKFLKVIFFVLILLSCSNESPIRQGSVKLIFSDPGLNDGRPLPVWTYIPSDYNENTRILFVMHGNGRNAKSYRDAWIDHAEKYSFLLVVPEFSREQFPKASNYNMGNMFKMDANENIISKNSKNLWSFSLIEPIFDFVKKRTRNKSHGYFIYGHSAGSQFVHRFMFFIPESRVEKAVFANAGWYTMPDFNTEFPYGLKKTSCTLDHLKDVFSKKVIVLLGDKDTDPDHPQLRKTPQAMAQGKNRFERGHTFFKKCRDLADSSGFVFNWVLDIVPGAEHSNKQMAPAAAKVLFE